MSWSVLSFVLSLIWYLTLAYVTFITTHIILDCKGLRNDEIPGNQRLCEDVSLLLSFNKPSDTFLNNIINSYTAVISEMQSDVSKWNSEKWSNVMSTDKITVEKKKRVLERSQTMMIPMKDKEFPLPR